MLTYQALIKEMMQAFIKSTALAEFWPIQFVLRLVVLSAALYFLPSRSAHISLESWPESLPSAGLSSTSITSAGLPLSLPAPFVGNEHPLV